ncbi:MAG: FKBP-type peptidyl-prolyl cis-trans isomerase [bacterium]
MDKALPESIGQTSKVTLHYSLAVEDGTVIDSNFDEEPLIHQMGDGSLIPGLEHALIGLKAGDHQTLAIPAEFGFGHPDPAAIQAMPLSDFPPDLQPEVRQIISFTLAGGEDVPGTVLEVSKDSVKVDFNHPLAGHEVTFKCHILAVENG